MNPKYLNEQEQAQVIAFTQNKSMFDAVKKVLLGAIYHQGTIAAGLEPTDKNWAFSLLQGKDAKTDDELGQELRASIAALGYLNSALERLEEFKAPEAKKEKKNPAL